MFDWIVPLYILAQRNGEEWVNILFIVVVAVFWLIGGLVKAAGGRKSAPQRCRPDRPSGAHAEKRDTWQQRLARKAEEIKQAADERIRTLQQQSESATGTKKEAPHPAAHGQGRVAMRTRRGGESVLVYERHDGREAAEQKHRRAAQAEEAAATRRRQQLEPKSPRVTPTHSSGPRGLSSIGHRPKPLDLDESLPTSAPAEGYSPASLIDRSDPDALKRAILHCEILGKPLGLRDPLQQISDF
jgi:hypothetical protein